jgi:hypothetical protein
MSYMRSERYVDEDVSEIQQANKNPMRGYENLPVMTLEKAAERIVPSIDDVVKYAADAKMKCNRTVIMLIWDESAAIYLYTIPTPFF